MEASSPLLLLLAPFAFIGLSTAVLLQFKLLYGMFFQFATSGSKVLKGTLLEGLRPSLKNVALNLESIYGPAATWKPNTTHILLVAVMLSVLYGLDRVRSEIARGNALKAKRD